MENLTWQLIFEGTIFAAGITVAFMLLWTTAMVVRTILCSIFSFFRRKKI